MNLTLLRAIKTVKDIEMASSSWLASICCLFWISCQAGSDEWDTILVQKQFCYSWVSMLVERVCPHVLPIPIHCAILFLISSLSIWAYNIEKIFLVVAGVAGSVVMTNDILQALETTAGMTVIRSLLMIGSDCHFSFLQRLEFFTFANPIFNR